MTVRATSLSVLINHCRSRICPVSFVGMVTYCYKIGAEIALATLDAVFIFIVAFYNRGGFSTEVVSRAHRLHLQGAFQTLFPTAPDACKVLILFL